MRAPIILLIVLYGIAVVGLTLVPGVDAAGKPAPPLSFFHAFYFISYTATTIGFGEIPNAFSDAQRMWVTVCIYLTVVGWSYSDTLDIAAIGDVMDDRGWNLDRQQGGLHLMVSPYHATVVDDFLGDLAFAAAHHGESRGVAASYGGVV